MDVIKQVADLVDVVLLTKNSECVLTKCLNALYQNVPVHQLIVVDGYSTDNTLAIIKKYQQMYSNIKIIFDHGTRASARQKGIQEVQTEWFLFLDSDVVLCRNWYQKAIKCLTSQTGAVWGIEVWSTIKNLRMLKLFLIVTHKIAQIRGGTHDALIKTALVKDIRIPSKLHVFEDTYIKDHITKKGYDFITCYDPFCIHYRSNAVWTLKGSINLITESLQIGNSWLIIKLLLSYSIYTVYAVYQIFTNNRK